MAAALGLSLAAPAPAQQTRQSKRARRPTELITEDDVITGQMNIEFATRTHFDSSGDLVKGSPALGIKDVYKIDLSVAKTTQFAGVITARPTCTAKVLTRRKLLAVEPTNDE